ncbi:MAG: hypothetical protein MJH10_21475 [Epibacterium sp.]|nr:hypothetical protein [Epibacterium sp.]
MNEPAPPCLLEADTLDAMLHSDPYQFMRPIMRDSDICCYPSGMRPVWATRRGFSFFDWMIGATIPTGHGQGEPALFTYGV